MKSSKNVPVRPAIFFDGQLKLLLDHRPEQGEEAHEVALAGAVGPDEHVQAAELELLERLDRLEPPDRDSAN